MPHIIPNLSQIFPKLTLYLLEGQTDVLFEKLKVGKLDAAIVALPVADKSLEVLSLFEEEFLLAVPLSHPFAKRKTAQPALLMEQHLLLLEDGHCLREQALSVCHSVKAKALDHFRATSLETLRHMVSAGIGMTLIPYLAKKSHDGIAYLNFESPKPTRKLGLIFRRSTARKLLLEEMAKQIKKILAKHKEVKVIMGK